MKAIIVFFSTRNGEQAYRNQRNQHFFQASRLNGPVGCIVSIILIRNQRCILISEHLWVYTYPRRYCISRTGCSAPRQTAEGRYYIPPGPEAPFRGSRQSHRARFLQRPSSGVRGPDPSACPGKTARTAFAPPS